MSSKSKIIWKDINPEAIFHQSPQEAVVLFAETLEKLDAENSLPHEEKLAELLFYYTYSLFKLSRFNEALVLAKGRARSVISTLHNKYYLGRLELLTGIIHYEFSEFESSHTYYRNALLIFQEIRNKKFESFALCNLGILYQRLGDYSVALTSLFEALSLQEELGDVSPEMLASLASIHVNTGELHISSMKTMVSGKYFIWEKEEIGRN